MSCVICHRLESYRIAILRGQGSRRGACMGGGLTRTDRLPDLVEITASRARSQRLASAIVELRLRPR